jgi:hypothetical protein
LWGILNEILRWQVPRMAVAVAVAVTPAVAARVVAASVVSSGCGGGDLALAVVVGVARAVVRNNEVESVVDIGGDSQIN